MHVRNQHPAQLTAIQGGLREARAEAKGAASGSLAMDLTSLWLLNGDGRDRIRLDGEIVRVEAAVRLGLGSGFDVEGRLPILHFSGGFLDPFIESWHRFFGLPQNLRDVQPSGRAHVLAERDTGSGFATAYDLDPQGVHIGDVPLFLSWFPMPEAAALSFGLRAGVEIPTGNEDLGFGNGALDYSAGALLELQVLDPLRVFASYERTFLGQADRARRAGLRYDDLNVLALGVSLRVFDSFVLLGQAHAEDSVLQRLEQDHARRSQLMWFVGGRFALADGAELELGVGEDGILDLSPDVTFHVAFGFH